MKKEIIGKCLFCNEDIFKGDDYKEVNHLHYSFDLEASQHGYKIIKQSSVHIKCFNKAIELFKIYVKGDI